MGLQLIGPLGRFSHRLGFGAGLPACRHSIVVVLASAFAATEIAAQENIPSGPAGVWHELQATLNFDPRSPHAKPKHESFEAHARVAVRISDHAPGTSFFGLVTGAFPAVHPGREGALLTIWRDRKCHPNRGLPKVFVTEIKGQVSDGKEKTDISAVPRQVGQLIPADEIVVARRMSGHPGNLNTEWTLQATTSLSRMVLDLKLRTQRCDLPS